MTKPMLACPLHKGHVADWHDWAIEEKYDGHRLIVLVGQNVVAWTRPRRRANGDKAMAVRPLPSHLTAALSRLPAGVYDGELVGGFTSTDVTRRDLRDELRFVVFDALEYEGRSVTALPYDHRRELLNAIFTSNPVVGIKHVTLTESRRLTCQSDVTDFVEAVWTRGGEGAILKRRRSSYQAGKRSPDWLKLKKLHTTVCTVVGFEATKGEVLDRGRFAIVLLEDGDGHRTSVKTKDDEALAEFDRQWITVCQDLRPEWQDPNASHPSLGRLLRIEYQDRTPDGGYRHPRWDRWEDE